MKQIAFLSLLLSVLVLTVNAQKVKPKTSACPGTNGLTQAEMTGIVDAHNKIRAGLGLPKLVWDCALATVAQTWAKRGIFEHRAEGIYGENLYVSSSQTIVPTYAIDRWLSEKAGWNNSIGTCQEGKICTHYTQMVWRKTTRIGCGINRNAPGKWKVLMVCNYSPNGNTGGKAY